MFFLLPGRKEENGDCYLPKQGRLGKKDNTPGNGILSQAKRNYKNYFHEKPLKYRNTSRDVHVSNDKA